MSRQDKINAERLREQAGEAGKAARQFADQGVEWAGPRVDAARDWASPKVDAAVEWASPRVEKALRSGVQAAAPKVAEYAEKSRGVVDAAHGTINDTVIPRVVDAMDNAAKAANDGLQRGADSALEAAATEQVKSSSKVGKTLGWALAGAAVAGAGVLIWKRTQPTEDPWAEEYWDDAPATAPATPATPAATSARHAASPAEGGDSQGSSASAESQSSAESAESPEDSSDTQEPSGTENAAESSDQDKPAADSESDTTGEGKESSN